MLPLPPSLLQALGAVLIGVGAWLEVQEQSIVDIIDQQVFLAGPYLLIAAGCLIVIISLVGMLGAFCSHKCNRVLLVVVSLLVYQIANSCFNTLSTNIGE
jgi:hypothetical protein